MLRARIATALTMVAILFFAVRWDMQRGQGWGFAFFQAILVAGALHEFYRMARSRGAQPFAIFGIPAGALLILGTERWCLERFHGQPPWFPDMDPLLALYAIIIVAPLLRQLFYKSMDGAFFNIGATVIGIFYVAFLPSYYVRIRHLSLGGGWQHDGADLLFVSILVAKLADVGGFLIGSTFGRRSLIPKLSPKKTWEGLAGGIVFSLATLLAVAAAYPEMTALHALSLGELVAFGLILALASLGGDLIESAFKRDSQVKDAGHSVPGFGGILDLVDSLVIAGPSAYYYLILCGARHGG